MKIELKTQPEGTPLKFINKTDGFTYRGSDNVYVISQQISDAKYMVLNLGSMKTYEELSTTEVYPGKFKIVRDFS